VKRALIALVALAVPASAAPAERRMVAILDLRVEGVDGDIARQYERSVEEQLDTNAFWLAGTASVRARMKFSTKWTTGCVAGPCLVELATQTSAELALLASFEGDGTNYGYIVTLVRTDNGRVLSQESGRCDVCTAKEATRVATLATIKLLNDVPDKLPDENAEHRAQIDLAVGKLERRMSTDHSRWKHRGIGLLVTGLAVAAGGVAAYILTDEAPALAVAGAGGGMLLGGMIVLSF
jgi:hypothetical protein